MDARDNAEAMALKAFTWLCDDENLRTWFLNDTGMAPGSLSAALQQPTFLAAVMDFVMADDRRVLAFCAAHSLPPEAVMRARAHLPGGDLPHWT